MVIGRSPNSGINATLGIVSASSGLWRTWRGGAMERYLRLDATLYPGSSGGAVIDAEGQVIGIATSALSRISGLAIPAETVERVLADLLRQGRVSRAYLGVGLQPIALPDHLKQQSQAGPKRGLIVLSVEPGGPAESAGLLVGDIFVSLAGTATEDTDDVQMALEGRRPGDSLQVDLVRAGAPAAVTIVLGERPGRSE
jgi:S1-C subfamily serine protease